MFCFFFSEKEKKEKDGKRRVLLIACAGSHQIWALFLDTTIWWKYKTFTEGRILTRGILRYFYYFFFIFKNTSGCYVMFLYLPKLLNAWRDLYVYNSYVCFIKFIRNYFVIINGVLSYYWIVVASLVTLLIL